MKKSYWILLVSILLTIAVYSYGFFGVFIYDDYDQVVKRAALHNIFNLHDVIFCGLRQNRLWQNLILALSWTISPGQTWSFKLFNLMLHLINGSLLFLWLKKLFTDKPYLPILATALFLIHPLQIQSVTYVMGVTTLVQAFFYLLSLYWYSKYSLTRMPGLILILIASLFAKETCVLIPLVLLAYEILINKATFRSLPKAKWAILFAIPFLYIPLYAILKDPVSMYKGADGFDLYPFWHYLVSQLYFQSFYLTLFANPSLQGIMVPLPKLDTIKIILAIIGALTWLYSGYFIFFKSKKFPRVSFLMVLFFISYLPTGSFLQLINPFAEYRLYQSNFVLCLALAYFIFQFANWKNMVASFVVIFCAFYTFKNIEIWNNGVKIYMQSLDHHPTDSFINTQVGLEHLRLQHLTEADTYLTKARYYEGRLPRNLALDFMMIASLYIRAKDYENAWKIIQRIESDSDKDPLPPQFYKFRDSVESKILLTKSEK